MSNVLIIGAGAVGQVTTHKCAQADDVFSHVCLASRNVAKCDAIAGQLKRPIQTAEVDARDAQQVAELIRSVQPKVVINVALPYQNLSIMDACLETGVDYLDTAAYEPIDQTVYSYQWQWEYHERFSERGIMAMLGCGFDPGVTNVFCAYALKEHFDELYYVDIYDCNAGDHGKPFATNFNPEINLREITQKGRYYENGEWITIDPLSQAVDFDYPSIGPRKSYLIFHEELESLVKHLPDVKRIRFFMTFSEKYITHLHVLENVGLTSIEPILYEGREIVPIQFLKALLPDPASLAPNYKGKTCIGNVMEGVKDGETKRVFVYNICDHEETYKEVGSQAVSYTAGVPPMIGAMLMVQDHWRKPGVYNPEQMNPTPFMDALNKYGLPWHERTL